MQSILHFIIDTGVAIPIPLAWEKWHHLNKGLPHNTREQLPNTTASKPPQMSNFL